jgi:hypothetical protein
MKNTDILTTKLVTITVPGIMVELAQFNQQLDRSISGHEDCLPAEPSCYICVGKGRKAGRTERAGSDTTKVNGYTN